MIASIIFEIQTTPVTLWQVRFDGNKEFILSSVPLQIVGLKKRFNGAKIISKVGYSANKEALKEIEGKEW